MKTLGHIWSQIVNFVDSDYFPEGADAARAKPEKMEFARCIPFIILHIGCLGVIWTGWSCRGALPRLTGADRSCS